MASYLSDFNAADGAVPAGQMTFLVGSGTIASNRLVLAAGSPVKLGVRPETLTRDNYIVSAIVRAGSSASSAQRGGIAFCVTDSANYYYVTFKPGAFGNVYLYRVKAFTTTLLVTHPSGSNINLPVDTDMDLEARVEGIGSGTVSIGVYLNDALLFSFDDSADPLTSPGRAGVYLGDAAGDSYQFDDLSIVEGQATPVVDIVEENATVMTALGETTYDYDFTATATDEEDGDLTASISWRYRTDGGSWNAIPPGGGSASVSLPIGVNEVEASVTDSNTATGTETVTITVEAFAFGGAVPVANGFVAGNAGMGHTSDTYSGDGVRIMITEQPASGRIFIDHTGALQYEPGDNVATEISFKYRIEDQYGFSNEATITLRN